MRKLKYIIFVVILFITIGFATINYTLSIDGDTELSGDLSDFNVYFSQLKINGVDSPESIISDDYTYSTDEYCGGSLYRDWLIIDKY